MIERPRWPHAEAVVSLGTNGRTVWHVAPDYLLDVLHWRVSGGRLIFAIDTLPDGRGLVPARRVDRHTVCLDQQPCAWIMQRVTP